MGRQGLGLKNSLVRHLSSLITASRITVMKHVLRLQLKAMRYSLPLLYRNHPKGFPTEVDHPIHLPALRRRWPGSDNRSSLARCAAPSKAPSSFKMTLIGI
jgi:hypothetical protein